MMSKKIKKTVEQEINECLEVWGAEEMISFIHDSIDFVDIYNVSTEEEVNDQNKITLRSIRTVYHVSYMAEKYSALMSKIRVMFPRLYERLENVDE